MGQHYQADAGLADFVRALPKTETHLHLEGSVAFEQLHAFDPERYPEPPEFWAPDYRYDGFDHFQSMFDRWIIPYHSRADHYAETARGVFARCVEEGCRYVEVSIHLPSVERVEVNGPELIDAILRQAPSGLEVRLFGGMSHVDYGHCGALLEDALGWDALTGIDLHGPENLPVDAEFPDYWRRARAQGKVTKAHAGEFMPAEFVEWTLDNLAPHRIEHGTRAIESQALVERLAASDVFLDMSVISNLKLCVEGVREMRDHPIRQLRNAGVKVTLSTDDTFLFGHSLREEYYALATDLEFTRAELAGVARCGFEAALVEPDQRRRWVAELDALLSAS